MGVQHSFEKNETATYYYDFLKKPSLGFSYRVHTHTHTHTHTPSITCTTSNR